MVGVQRGRQKRWSGAVFCLGWEPQCLRCMAGSLVELEVGAAWTPPAVHVQARPNLPDGPKSDGDTYVPLYLCGSLNAVSCRLSTLYRYLGMR